MVTEIKQVWERWFAWHPVHVFGIGPVWLRRVERRHCIAFLPCGSFAGAWNEYRLPLESAHG